MKLFQRKKAHHTLFDLNSESVAAWVNRLPRANLAQTGKQLYRAVDELSKLECPFKQRLEVLEALRPSVNLVLRGLRPRYLNASIVLPEKTTTVVRFCNALNTRLAENYRQVSNAILARSWVGRYRLSLALSLHRELSEHSQLLLRRYNLYQGEDEAFWERVHTCYRVARQFQLTNTRIIDSDYGNCTLERAYLRPMLFVGAHPYQLTQQFQIKLYDNLHWLCEYSDIHEIDPRKYCFVFDLTGTQAPVYQELCEHADGWFGIDTTKLVSQIKRQLKSNDLATSTLPPPLCRKLLRAWSSISDRIEQRDADIHKLEMAVGLSSTHFFVANETPLDIFKRDLDKTTIRSDDEALKNISSTPIPRQERQSEEITVEIIDYSNLAQKVGVNSSHRHRHFLVQTVNTSRNGYCISWPARESHQLRNGDVICMREQDAPCWSVGCIRWIKKHTDEELHAGISILSHAAEPYIARQLEGGPIYRTLLLGAESVSGKQKSVLFPNVSLPEDTEMELIRPSDRLRIHLKAPLQQTRDFSLYSYDFEKKSSQLEDIATQPDVVEEWEFS